MKRIAQWLRFNHTRREAQASPYYWGYGVARNGVPGVGIFRDGQLVAWGGNTDAALATLGVVKAYEDEQRAA